MKTPMTPDENGSIGVFLLSAIRPLSVLDILLNLFGGENPLVRTATDGKARIMLRIQSAHELFT